MNFLYSVQLLWFGPVDPIRLCLSLKSLPGTNLIKITNHWYFFLPLSPIELMWGKRSNKKTLIQEQHFSLCWSINILFVETILPQNQCCFGYLVFIYPGNIQRLLLIINPPHSIQQDLIITQQREGFEWYLWAWVVARDMIQASAGWVFVAKIKVSKVVFLETPLLLLQPVSSTQYW